MRKFITLGMISLSLLAVSAIAQTFPINSAYSWLSSYENGNALKNRIAPPDGFTRTKCAAGSYCDWVRNVPLKPEGSPVRYYDGNIKHHASHHSVLDLDTGEKNLQHCADAVIRLKAEYHYSRKEFSKIKFDFTSGDTVSFDDWRRGRKPIVRGNKVSFTKPKNSTNNSYSNFKDYLTIIFSYAGTISLSNEMKSVNIRNIRIGDAFVVGGSPGHAVLVIDMAENAAGEKMFLLAQSYMPAQDMHILKNFNHPGDGPWYSANFDGKLYTPEWHFEKTDLKRFVAH